MKNYSIFRKKGSILLSILLLVGQMLAAAAVRPEGQNARLTLSFKNAPLKTVLASIERQNGCYFVYNHKFIDDSRKTSIQADGERLVPVLDRLFAGTPVCYTVMDRQIVLRRRDGAGDGSLEGDSLKRQGQPVAATSASFRMTDLSTRRIEGRVRDADGRPLPGVSIYMGNMMTGTASRSDGSFSLTVPDTVQVLVFSMVGYERLEVRVPEDGKVEVIMKDEVQRLAEAVITGYQVLSRERATGSFSTISTKDMKNRLETNIMSKFEGMVPGLYMEDGAFTIRGISTIHASRSPLFVVDGFPYVGSISFINPADVINVTVLKDAAAASIYGAQASNGVIVITTRSGKSGKLDVNVNSSVFITPLPDVSYLHLMGSRDIVDMQEELFNMKHLDYSIDRKRMAKPRALDLLYMGEAGEISADEMHAGLDALRKLDNRSQIEEYLLQKSLKHQHSFSVTGGNRMNRFLLSVNYIGNRGYEKRGKDENLNINFKDDLHVAPWMDVNLGIAASFNHATRPLHNIYSLYTMHMPYEMICDGEGEMLRWSNFKSDYEIERLKGLGLFDESYNPLREMDRFHSTSRYSYLRLQGGVSLKFLEGLKLDLSYQTEIGNSKDRSLYAKDSYYARRTVNDATQIRDGEIIRNVPEGAILNEGRGDNHSYTMRAQLDFDRVFASRHRVTSIIGAERRSVAYTRTNVEKLGYNEANMQYPVLNAKDLYNVKGTESLYGSFSYNEKSGNSFGEGEDRYVSFYGNFGYTFDGKYTLTASARIDDSNLFGTDPKYRHLPMWSVGASWQLSDEDFMQGFGWLDRLALRVTYGLTGNITRQVGPYLQAQTLYSTESEAPSTRIVSPPNKSLRWERTDVTNVGLDFGFLKNRISGSVDYYYRKTTDLLGDKEVDPTNAFQTSLINYGSLYNKGFEFSINSLNVRAGDFEWRSELNYSHNRNKLTEISVKNETVYAYTNGFGCDKEGYPLGGLFNYRWAGLDPENGTPMVYDKEGNVVRNYDESGMPVGNMRDPEGLVYAGTIHPKYTVGFNNSFTWKGLTLDIMLIANGGHVMRDAVPDLLDNGNFDRNMEVRAKNFWRKPGDEKIPGIMPAPDVNGNGDAYYMSLWYCADINTMKADYIKIRSISLSYDIPASLFRNRAFRTARLTFQVQNPFKWFRNSQDLDPEAYFAGPTYSRRTLPVTPCYMLGLDLNF